MSAVVTTLIIILLVLVAVGIVWLVVNNLIADTSKEISIDKFNVNIEIRNVTLVDDNLIKITIRRNPGAGNISGVILVMSNGTDSERSEKSAEFKELEERTFSIDPEMKASEITSVSVLSVFSTGSENLADNCKLVNGVCIPVSSTSSSSSTSSTSSSSTSSTSSSSTSSTSSTSSGGGIETIISHDITNTENAGPSDGAKEGVILEINNDLIIKGFSLLAGTYIGTDCYVLEYPLCEIIPTNNAIPLATGTIEDDYCTLDSEFSAIASELNEQKLILAVDQIQNAHSCFKGNPATNANFVWSSGWYSSMNYLDCSEANSAYAVESVTILA